MYKNATEEDWFCKVSTLNLLCIVILSHVDVLCRRVSPVAVTSNPDPDLDPGSIFSIHLLAHLSV